MDLNGKKELEAGGPRKSRSEEIHVLNSSTNITESVTQIYQKSRSHLKTLGARRVTRSKFHSHNPPSPQKKQSSRFVHS